MNKVDWSNIRKRDDLPPRLRAISDALDEYLLRMHGICTSWANPFEFLTWLEERGYTVDELAKELEDDNMG
jgi:hypothetical protein